MGYLFGISQFSWLELLALSVGGFLVTGSSNGINQVIERQRDSKMKRTQNRPIPSGEMNWKMAAFVCVLAGVLGLFTLYYFFHFKAFMLGLGALVSYAFIYTPLKPITSFAVFVGAFPGAIPPMLGYVAATNQFDLASGLLFITQFIWQFPHFWAIAWVLDDDYSLGGFKLLPSVGGKNKTSAFQILIYTLFTLPIGLLPWAFELTGIWSVVVVTITGLIMVYYAFRLYFSGEDADAKKLMFSSFLYLPAIQIVYLLDKLV